MKKILSFLFALLLSVSLFAQSIPEYEISLDKIPCGDGVTNNSIEVSLSNDSFFTAAVTLYALDLNKESGRFSDWSIVDIEFTYPNEPADIYNDLWEDGIYELIYKVSVKGYTYSPQYANFQLDPVYFVSERGCGDPLPAPTITGATSITGIPCSIMPYTGTLNMPYGKDDYEWEVISGGNIVSGQGTYLINVSWNTTGTTNRVRGRYEDNGSWSDWGYQYLEVSCF